MSPSGVGFLSPEACVVVGFALGGMDAAAARRRFELENDVVMLDEADKDKIYEYDEVAASQLLNEAPWNLPGNEEYFKKVKISAVALIKMALHAGSTDLEVMGLMQGKMDGDTFIVMDSFALPVVGEEAFVHAQIEAYEYIAVYKDHAEQVGRVENPIGWYHSHPGFGCWLSSTDVQTQRIQQHSGPFLAVVIDPKRTAAAGKVEIGAYRTYPADYVKPNQESAGYQQIPIDKIEEFGVFWNHYYELDVSFFKSSLDTALLDLLWDKYWVNTLCSSPLFSNMGFMTGQLTDLALKLEQAEAKLRTDRSFIGFRDTTLSSGDKEELEQLSKDSFLFETEELTFSRVTTTMEFVRGQMTLVLKDLLFNCRGRKPCTPA